MFFKSVTNYKTMGAACSTSVDMKYRILKTYFKGSECLTFEEVIGLLPRSQANFPPVVLVGEQHDWNESENKLFYVVDEIFVYVSSQRRYKTRCATLFQAMKKTVSDCDNPESKVVFFIEDTPKDYGVGSDHPRNFKPTGDDRFFLQRERERNEHLVSRYSGGIQTIGIDIFHLSRLSIIRDPNDLANVATDTLEKTNMEIILAFKILQPTTMSNDERLDAAKNELQPIFEIAYSQNQPSSEQYSKYERIVAKNNAMGEHNISVTDLIQARWIAIFALVYIERMRTTLDKDLARIQLEISYFISRITTETDAYSYTKEIFYFMTLVGDALAYCLFVRPFFVGQLVTNKTVLVFYTGSLHTMNLKRWLSYGGYKEDFSRSARKMTDIYQDMPERPDVHRYDVDDPNLSAEYASRIF